MPTDRSRAGGPRAKAPNRRQKHAESAEHGDGLAAEGVEEARELRAAEPVKDLIQRVGALIFFDAQAEFGEQLFQSIFCVAPQV